MTGPRGHNWASYQFGRRSSTDNKQYSNQNNSDEDSPTPMEKRQGYFDLSVGDDASQDARPQQLPGPRIFTIEPSISSLEDDDHKTEVPSNNNGNNQGPPNDEKPRVQFRPKLEYIGRVYSTAASVTTLDDQPRSRKERAINFLHRRFPTRIVRRVLKCTLAYFISTLFSLINPVAQALGTSASMTTAGMLFNHPGRTMGAQFDSTLTSALGICCGMGFCFAGLACSVAYNVRHPDTIQYGAIINALFLFLGIFSAQMLRQFYPRFFFFSLQAMIMFIFNFSTIPGMGQTVLPKDLPLQIGLPLLCGAAISQLVNLCVWPETAVEGLGRALKETSKSSKEMLDMITKQFFLDPESEMVPGEVVDETAEKMRKGMTKVKTAYKEAKYEISYTYIRPYELGNIQKSLDRLTKHLNILGGSLKTERVLFETAIASLHAAEAASSTDEDTDSSDSTDDEHQLTHPHDEPRKSTLRWLTNEDELDLRRAAMLAAGHSPQNSRPNSRIGSRAGSRAGSRRNSLDDTDHEDQNQKSVSSLRSFLNLAKLSSPAPKPPRKKNRHLIEHGDGELLVTYLESLRDPLMRLSMECAPVLDCVSHSIEVELDMDDDDDKSIWKTWKAYIFHTFKIKKRKKNEEPKKSKYKHEPKDCDCAKTMSEAIKRFDKTEGDRMHTLYKLNMSRIGNEVLDLGMREELFLVFFFIFSLRQVATELESMAKAMDELRSSRPDRRRRHLYMPQFTQKWWRKWASSNDHQSVRDKGGYSLSNLQPAIPKDDRKVDATEEYRLRRIKTSETFSGKKARRMSSVASQTSSNIAPNLEKLSSTMTLRRQRTNTTKNSSQLSPPVEDHELSAMEAAMENKEPEIKPPLILRIRYSTWQSLQFLKKYEFKFALKMGLAVLGLSIPAFIPASMYWYSNSVRGQWACMTIIAIMNPTSGGTFEASFWRIVGTLTGALAGWAALEADGGSPYLLALFAVLLSIPFFYMHLASTFNKVGTVVLMTYMAVALSRYVQSPDEPISETVWKRTATVVVGILVAVSLNWVIWPFVARHAVRKSISGTIGELGDYYTYLMGTFLFNELQASDDDVKKAQKIESKIQKSIDACAVLLELTDHEPRLKGPFPKDFYKEMIVSTRNILDRLLSMRTALISMPSSVKKDICLQDYNVYRRDMTASMLLHFYTLQSSLNSKIPLPAYMPSARSARTRLIRYRRKEAKSTQQFVRFKNLCWFAMASSTEEIIEELEHLNDLIRFIVGESKYADRARRIDALL